MLNHLGFGLMGASRKWRRAAAKEMPIAERAPLGYRSGYCLLLREDVRFGWWRVSTESFGFGLGPTDNVLEFKEL